LRLVILLDDCGRETVGSGLKEMIMNKNNPIRIPMKVPAMNFKFFILFKF